MALPATAIYSLAVCIACGLLRGDMWLQFVMLVVSSCSMMFLNNTQSLIRIYSRMVTCSYMMLFIMAGLLMQPVGVGIVMQCVIMFYLLLFPAYQSKGSTGLVFYAFLMLGIASTVFVPILFYVPLALVLLYTHILSGTTRTFFASVLGLLVPYWFLCGYYIYVGRVSDIVYHFESLWPFDDVFGLSSLSQHQMVSGAMLVILSFTGIVHFYRNSYKDKIRTRMLFEIFISMDIFTVLFMILYPRYYDYLVGILIVNTSPVIAHFLTLTKTRATNVAFCVILFAVLLITVYNLWMPWLTF